MLKYTTINAKWDDALMCQVLEEISVGAIRQVGNVDLVQCAAHYRRNPLFLMTFITLDSGHKFRPSFALDTTKELRNHLDDLGVVKGLTNKGIEKTTFTGRLGEKAVLVHSFYFDLWVMDRSCRV